MTVPILEVGISVALAVGFGAVGERVILRRSVGVAEWNESMVAGMGVCASSLFLFSLVFPVRALFATATLMALAVIGALAERLVVRPSPTRPPPPRFDPATRLLIGATALVALGFAVLNFRYVYFWDGFLIWATKAQLLFHHGGLTRAWFPGDFYDLRHVAYPPLVPLYEALVSLLRGGFDFDKLKAVFPVFYASMLVGTFSAARAVTTPRLASVAVLMLSLLPALTTQTAAGACADMPQAAFLGAAVAASLHPADAALPWLIGALTTVKAEGTILAGLVCFGILLFWALESPRGLLARVRTHARGITIVAAMFGLRAAYLRWADVPDLVYERLDAPHLRVAMRRIPEVARLCLIELGNYSRWGLLWAAFLAAVIILIARGTHRERALAITTAVGVVVLATPFLLTSWPLELQISQAYFRLLGQLAPAAVTVVVAGYARLAGAGPTGAPHSGGSSR